MRASQGSVDRDQPRSESRWSARTRSWEEESKLMNVRREARRWPLKLEGEIMRRPGRDLSSGRQGFEIRLLQGAFSQRRSRAGLEARPAEGSREPQRFPARDQGHF